MKKLLLISVPSIIITYCLLTVISNYIGLGPLDTYPRTIQTVNCQNGIEAKVYRRKMILDFLIGTDNRLEIKKDNQEVLNGRLYLADIWGDVKPENTVLECVGNGVRTSSKLYFDKTFQIVNEKIINEKNNLPK